MKPPATIVDLDGTLCDLNGRDPYDASTCEQDLPNWDAINYVEDHAEGTVFIITGRMEKDRRPTKAWLKEHDVAYDELIMRGNDDYRKASTVKAEVYDLYIEPKFDVKFVIEDMPPVIKMWRDKGLTVIPVENGQVGVR